MTHKNKSEMWKKFPGDVLWLDQCPIIQTRHKTRRATEKWCLYVRILWRSVSESAGEYLTFFITRWPGTSHICGIRTHNPKFALIVYGILLKIILFNSTEHNLELNQISYGKEKSQRNHPSIIFFMLNFLKKYDLFSSTNVVIAYFL